MAHSPTLRPRTGRILSHAIAAALAALPANLAAQGASTPPTFRVDTSWPQSLPAGWNWDHGPDTRGSDVLGIRADAQDHIWVTNRGTVAEYDPEGKLLQSWSATENRKYGAIHGMWRDHQGNIWTTGRENHVVLQFTPAGKLIKSIGVYDETRGSDDKETMGRPAEVYVDPATNELFVADGYTNHRVVVFDAETGKYLRHWGANGEAPFDGPREQAPRLQYQVPHGIVGSRDGKIYVADRTNSRVQVFDRSGTFLQEGITRAGQGGAFSVALSTDPQQEWVYVTDGTEHRVWILRRSDMKVVGQFGREGFGPGEFGRPHNITVDSRGNIYVAEASPGQRAQKFVMQK
jgi:DNA-binding beta-propeller fold protein YncE